jgi:Bifunctional DNA primase/polymerase, N-terminal
MMAVSTKTKLPAIVADAATRHNWSIIPVGLDKKPFFSWKKWQNERASIETLEQWQRQHNPPAWAVITGAISNLIILDGDGTPGKKTFEDLGLNPHRRTGSGGLHCDFQYPGWRVPTLNSKSKIELGKRWPGLDIRGDGGYAVFYGNNTSGQYSWLRDLGELERLSILPENLRDFLGLLYAPIPQDISSKVIELRPLPQTPRPGRSIADISLEKYLQQTPPKGRNDACFELALQLRDNGYTKNEAETVALQFASRVHSTNTKGQHEPFTNEEATLAVASAFSSAARQPWTPLQNEEKGKRSILDGNNAPPSLPPSNGNPQIKNGDDLPSIFITGQLRDIYSEALTALVQGEQGKPTIFVQSGRLVQLVYNEKKQPIIKPVGIAELRNAMTRTANYFRLRKATKEESATGPEFVPVPVSPPKEDAEAILALDPSEWHFPPLKSVVEMPIMRPDGSILDKPGYDAITQIYYAGNPLMSKCKIPTYPSSEDIMQARHIIDACIGEFPYETDADRANAYGLLLTLVTRYMYSGDVQTALINATKQGTGKTLLAQVACIIATGRLPALTGFPSKEEETKKVIDAKVLAGVSLIVFDNIKRLFASTSLDQLTTGGGWYSVRPLGQSKDIPVEVQCTVIATGNNMQLDTDMARRCFQIRLVSPTSNPDERDDITIKELIEYTIEHRAELVSALLTLARAWFVAGKPSATNKLARAASSFTRWANTVGGILENAGITGFQDNRDELKSAANTEEQQIVDFLNAWHERFGDAWVLAKDIATILKTSASVDASVADSEPLLETLPDRLSEAFFEKDKSIKSMTLGLSKWLQKRIKTPYGQDNVHIEQQKDTHTHTQQWRVLRVLRV